MRKERRIREVYIHYLVMVFIQQNLGRREETPSAAKELMKQSRKTDDVEDDQIAEIFYKTENCSDVTSIDSKPNLISYSLLADVILFRIKRSAEQVGRGVRPSLAFEPNIETGCYLFGCKRHNNPNYD
ncbi:MAG: hypothetical protein ACE3JK_05930 [Sporolactobacillus sp.]